jgi:hypothetical protein
MTDHFNMGNGTLETRIALVGFANEGFQSMGTLNGARIVSGFTGDSSEFAASLQQTRSSGGTYLQSGLEVAEQLIQYEGRYDADKMVVVLLASQPLGSFASQANQTRTMASVVAMGYGSGANVTALQEIATPPYAASTYVADDLETVALLALEQTMGLCVAVRNETVTPTTSTQSPSSGAPSSSAPTVAGATYSPTATPVTDSPIIAPTMSPTTPKCNVTLDVIFVLDESGSTRGRMTYNGMYMKKAAVSSARALAPTFLLWFRFHTLPYTCMLSSVSCLWNSA